jgi:hypothetical protein
MPRFGFGSWAARPLSYWQYGHSALCASAFQECMADFGDNGITATAFGGEDSEICYRWLNNFRDRLRGEYVIFITKLRFGELKSCAGTLSESG